MGVAGMILVDYPLKDEIAEALIDYERDTKSSLNTLIEDFLEDFLIKKGYLGYELPIEDIKTPDEIQSERKEQFVKLKWEDNVQIKFKEMNFGSFKQGIADDVIDKLSRYSDKELEEISKSNWQYPPKHYCDFLLSWLEDDGITPESYINSIINLIAVTNYKNKGNDYTRFEYKQQVVALFNHNKFSNEDIELSYSFLKEQTSKDLEKLIEDRKRLKEQSGKFILKQALKNKGG